MNLYEINAEILSLLEQVDPETGELAEDVAEQLIQLNSDFLTKADNVAAYIKNLEAESKAIKEEIDNLSSRRKAKENHIERLKSYLTDVMFASGNSKLETARVKLSVKTSQAVNILDLSVIPEKYHRTKTTDEADKVAIAAALKSGQEVKGAELVDRHSVIIK